MSQTSEMVAIYRGARTRLWGAPPKIVVPPKNSNKPALARVVLPVPPPPPPSMGGPMMIARIQRVVAWQFKISNIPEWISSERRTHAIIRPRQIAMYLAKTLTSRSLPDIGRRFGGLDHSTVLYAVRKVAELIQTDPKMAKIVAALRSKIVGLPD